jgi:hypothetical protein
MLVDHSEQHLTCIKLDITDKSCLSQLSLSRAKCLRKPILRSNLFVEINSQGGKSHCGNGENAGKSLGRRRTYMGDTPARHAWKSLDEVAAICVGVKSNAAQVRLAFTRLFVQSLADFENLVSILLVVVVPVLVFAGLFACNTCLGAHKRVFGIRKCVAIHLYHEIQ